MALIVVLCAGISCFFFCFFFLVVFRSMWLMLAFKGSRFFNKGWGFGVQSSIFCVASEGRKKRSSHELKGSKRVLGVTEVEIDKVKTKKLLIGTPFIALVHLHDLFQDDLFQDDLLLTVVISGGYCRDCFEMAPLRHPRGIGFTLFKDSAREVSIVSEGVGLRSPHCLVRALILAEELLWV